MKWFIPIIQIFVSVLFVVSGLVKANDPIGLHYKMQEFFELWNEGTSNTSFIHSILQYFHSQSLALAVSMILLEILAGVALLVCWKKKIFLWLLLLRFLIVF